MTETEEAEVKVDDDSAKKFEDRQNLIDTAVRFLTNPKVNQTPESAKREFLTKKGLTSSEINAALAKAVSVVVTSDTAAATQNVQNQIVQANVVNQTKPSFLMVVIKWIRNFLVAGCLAFTAYKLIVKKLMSKKKKNIEKTVDELKNSNQKLIDSIIEMKHSMNSLKESVELMSNLVKQNSKTSLNTEDNTSVRNEIQTIKNLLLNRSQFPNVPTVTPILPSWQLEKKNMVKEKSKSIDESDKEVTTEEIPSDQLKEEDL